MIVQYTDILNYLVVNVVACKVPWCPCANWSYPVPQKLWRSFFSHLLKEIYTYRPRKNCYDLFLYAFKNFQHLSPQNSDDLFSHLLFNDWKEFYAFKEFQHGMIGCQRQLDARGRRREEGSGSGGRMWTGEWVVKPHVDVHTEDWNWN